MSTADEDLVLERRTSIGRAVVAEFVLNRPAQLNPLNHATIQVLLQSIKKAVDEGEITCVVITGAGEAFSAGGDLVAYQQLYRDPPSFDRFISDFGELCTLIEDLPIPVISMVNGVCVAGGLELSLACDFITIADTARVGDGHLRFAQLPGAGGSQRLVRAIGVQRARQWLLTASLFPAAEAVATGLALFAAPPAELRDRTLAFAAQLAEFSPLALAKMKSLLTVAQRTTLPDGLRMEFETVFDYATTSADAFEGLLAFDEKRAPRYEAR